MLRYFSLLIIPISFTFVLDQTLNLFDEKKNISLLESPNTQENFYLNSDSATINKIYSEKFINNNDLQDFTKSEKNQIKIKKKKYHIFYNSKKIDSLDFVNFNWKKNYSQKKVNFIQTLLPLIEYENQKIFTERKKLLDIKNFLNLEKTLSKKNLKYLNDISKKYSVNNKNKHKVDLVDELLIKIDIIPNSIVLAQAANESAWGDSRFAREYNALFGQYTYNKNNGVVPKMREKGETHLIQNFSSINKSVESYFKNINTHYAYQEFREFRSNIRKDDKNLDINSLTNYLDSYAEDKSYVETINSIIKTNNFKQFDNINLFLNS